MDLRLLNWNVRGLNNPARRRAIQNRIRDMNCNFICLQETKIADFSRTLVSETLGPSFCDNFIFKPADCTRGGILIACSQDFSVAIITTVPEQYSLTANITDLSDGSSWSVTAVYGPQDA